MNNETLGKMAFDLLAIPPLVFRIVRKKLAKMSFADTDLDVRYPHFEILRLLDQEGTQHVARIGEHLEIAKAQMTQLIDHLVGLGLLERETDAADRRTFKISLTGEGKQFVKEQGARLVNAVRENMSCLDECELESLCASLRNVRDTLLKLEA